MTLSNETPREIDNLLEVKLEKPLADVRIVHRARLTEQLSAGLKQRLSLLVAPTGYGKTTLLVEWLSLPEFENWQTAWITLDEFCNTPLRFWAYFTSGIRNAFPSLRFNPQQMAQGSQNTSDFSAFNPLINEISEIPFPMVLVLDNYHTITDEAIHTNLAYLIEHQPANLHLVISSRSTPPIPLSRLRAQRQMVEIKTPDLSFTVPEAETFLKKIMGLDLEFEQVNAFMEATEGWPAGIQLAALTYQSQESFQRLQGELPKSNRLIFEYLTEEVLNQQSPEVKEFLLKTSILEEMCAPLCNELLGSKNSQDMLVWLERANLFTTCLDERQHWYRYHSLFAEALRAHLQKTYPNETPDLHRKAFSWLHANDIPYKAVSHALAAGDLKEAAELLDQSVLQAFNQFDLKCLVQWIGHFSQELFVERPKLVIYNALANYHLGRKDLVEVNLQLLDALLEKAVMISKEEKVLVSWQAAALRVTLRLHEGIQHEEINKLIKIIEARPAEDPYFLSFLTFSLAQAQKRAGDVEAAAESFTRICQIALQQDDASFFTHALIELGRARKTQGRLGLANQEFTKALKTTFINNPDPGVIALCQIGLLEIMLEQNDLDAAREIAASLVKNYHELLDSQTVYLSLDLISSYLVKYSLAVGDIENVKHHFNNMIKYLPEKRGNFPGMPWELTDVQARVGIFMKERSQEHQLAELQAFLESKQKPTVNEQIALSRIYLAHQMYDLAQARLEKLKKFIRTKEPGEQLIETLVLLALAYHAQGYEEAAFKAIEEALLIGAPEGYVRVFIGEGQPMHDLLNEYIQEKLSSSDSAAHKKLLLYCEKLISEMDDTTGATAKPLAEKLPQAKVLASPEDSLTQREIEVLKMLVAGNSYKEMATTLMISVNTVKAHVKHIYRKLGSSTRKGIYERARELDLIHRPNDLA